MERIAYRNSQWTRWIVTALAVCLGIFVWEAVSDEPPAADRPHKVPVAVIDIGRAIKEGRRFDDKIHRLKDEIEAFEIEVRTKQAEIGLIADPKAPASAPSSGADAEKMERASKLQTEVLLKKKSVLDKEAKIYLETYEAIEKAVQRVSLERDIGIVIRHHVEPMDLADRASILKGVDRTVVYSAVPDITNEVLAELNDRKR